MPSARNLHFLSPSGRIAELPFHIQALLFPRPWRDLVASVTGSHAAPELYFRSLLRQECLLEPTEVSGGNAIGLAQVISDTGGAWYLRRVWEDVDRNRLMALVSSRQRCPFPGCGGNG